jgi:uncharacterized protein YjbI with pentapeptide repeats
MLKRLFVTASISLFALSATGTAAMATEDLLRLIGFGGICADCDLSGKDLSGVSMRGASFPRADFTGANLSEAKISGANFGRAVFKRADFSNAVIEGSNFGRSDLTGAKMDDVTAKGINMSYAILDGVQGRDSAFSGTNFSHSSLVGAKFPESEFDHSVMTYANLSGIKLNEASMRNVQLVKANLDGANLVDVNFENANLTKAVFGQADVKNASFEFARLSGADLSKVKNLKQEQLDDACGDDNTALPPKLTLALCKNARWVHSGHRMGDTDSSFAIAFEFSDEDRAQIAKASREVLKESGYAVQKARIAIAEAMTEDDFPKITIKRNGQTFIWPNFDDARSSEQRAIQRAQQSLVGLKLDNRRAQRALNVAIRSLKKAQLALTEAQIEREMADGELAGGKE